MRHQNLLGTKELTFCKRFCQVTLAPELAMKSCFTAMKLQIYMQNRHFLPIPVTALILTLNTAAVEPESIHPSFKRTQEQGHHAPHLGPHVMKFI